MTTTAAPRAPRIYLLHNGGTLFINQMGRFFTVGVEDVDSAPTDDPVYHAFYASEDEAQADAAQWKKWEDV